jgi:hypothetical protein
MASASASLGTTVGWLPKVEVKGSACGPFVSVRSQPSSEQAAIFAS